MREMYTLTHMYVQNKNKHIIKQPLLRIKVLKNIIIYCGGKIGAVLTHVSLKYCTHSNQLSFYRCDFIRG